METKSHGNGLSNEDSSSKLIDASAVATVERVWARHVKENAVLYSKHSIEIATRDEDAAALALKSKLLTTEFSGTKLLTSTPNSKTGNNLATTNSQLLLEDVVKRVKMTPSELAVVRATPHKGSVEVPSADAVTSRALQVRRAVAPDIEPEIHRPWRCFKVFAGHLGVPRAVAVDPSNRIFATGGMDNVIKIFDLATGNVLTNFSGHSHPVRGLAFSPKHPYLFSVSEDKEIKCWDLELNQIVRQYHGHTAGVYCIAVHPTTDTIVSGGRDGTCRVWDIRTRTQVFSMTGHKEAVVSLGVQNSSPQVVSGSEDSTVRLWSLESGRCMQTLTYHKKGVRALSLHPTQFAFASASTGSIKKCTLPDGTLMQDFQFGEKEPRSLIHSLATSRDGKCLVSGMGNGYLRFWDWNSGKTVQNLQIKTMPGTLETETGVMAVTYDMTGERLIACVGDKTVQMFKPEAPPQPLDEISSSA